MDLMPSSTVPAARLASWPPTVPAPMFLKRESRLPYKRHNCDFNADRTNVA